MDIQTDSISGAVSKSTLMAETDTPVIRKHASAMQSIILTPEIPLLSVLLEHARAVFLGFGKDRPASFVAPTCLSILTKEEPTQVTLIPHITRTQKSCSKHVCILYSRMPTSLSIIEKLKLMMSSTLIDLHEKP